MHCFLRFLYILEYSIERLYKDRLTPSNIKAELEDYINIYSLLHQLLLKKNFLSIISKTAAA